MVSDADEATEAIEVRQAVGQQAAHSLGDHGRDEVGVRPPRQVKLRQSGDGVRIISRRLLGGPVLRPLNDNQAHVPGLDVVGKLHKQPPVRRHIDVETQALHGAPSDSAGDHSAVVQF